MKKYIYRILTISCAIISVCIISYKNSLIMYDDSKDIISGLDSSDSIPLSSEEESTKNLPVVSKVTVSATGDCALGKLSEHGYSGSFIDYYDTYGNEYFFQNVKNIFSEDDFTLVNLECVFSDSNDLVPKAYNIKGGPNYSSILTAGYVEGVTLGNNHTFDYGNSGHEDTISSVEGQGIEYAFNDHYGIYTTSEGITIGFISSNLCPSYRDGNADYIKEGILTLKDHVDLVIACPHWGVEKENYPNSTQTSLAHEFIDLGADLVIGNHPHVLQGIEVYNGKVICYSLGNFCFGANRNPSDKDTVIFQQTFTFIDHELQLDFDSKIIPCVISSSGSNDFCPTPADSRYNHIIERMNTYSNAKFGTFFDEKGTLIIE